MIIRPIPARIQVTVDRGALILPSNLQLAINRHWEAFNEEKPYLTRGELLAIHHLSWSDEQLQIILRQTDYAHFMYSQQLSPDHPDRYRGVVANGVFLTSDGYYVIGEMNASTSTPGRLQFVAGSLEAGDCRGDTVDLFASLARESQEEIGIDLTDTRLVSRVTPRYIVQWPSIALIYLIELAIDSRQLQAHYNHFEDTLIRQGLTPEFATLVFVHASSISAFLQNDPRRKLDFLPAVLDELSYI